MGFEVLKTATGILKIIEIILMGISIGIFRGQGIYIHAELDYDLVFFILGILVAALINSTFLLLCYLLGSTQIQKTVMEMSLNFLFCVLLMIGGGVAIDNGNRSLSDKKDAILTLGSFCILTSITYFIDTIAAFRNYRTQSLYQ